MAFAMLEAIVPMTSAQKFRKHIASGTVTTIGIQIPTIRTLKSVLKSRFRL